MKKIFCAVLMMFVMCSVSLGASEDMSVYVRKDVFDAKMELLLTRIEGKIDALSERINGLDKKIDGVEKSLSERINGLEKRMDVMDKRIDDGFNGMNKRIDEGLSAVNKRIDEGLSAVNTRIDDTHNFLYLIIVLLGIMLAVPFINKYWDFHKEHRTHFTTIEDVKRLIAEAIAENSAKIRA